MVVDGKSRGHKRARELGDLFGRSRRPRTPIEQFFSPTSTADITQVSFWADNLSLSTLFLQFSFLRRRDKQHFPGV